MNRRDGINARQELVEDVAGREVAYGKVVRGDSPDDADYLAVGFKSHEEYLAALHALDFFYDNGFGGQELFGFVVFTDGSWLERHEYDGSERWDYKKTPTQEYLAKYRGSSYWNA